MNKQEFLKSLRTQLAVLPPADVEASLEFYAEAIDDRMEAGLSEAAAVSEIGSVDEISAQILSEVPLPRLIRASVAPKRGLRAGSIALIALGSPVWASLLLAVAACLLAVCAVAASLIAAFYAVALALAGGAIAGLAGSILALMGGNPPGAGMSLGACMICAGLTLPLFFGINRLVGLCLKCIRKIVAGVRVRLIRRGNRK